MRHIRGFCGNKKEGESHLTHNDSGTRKRNLRRYQELHTVNSGNTVQHVECVGLRGVSSSHVVRYRWREQHRRTNSGLGWRGQDAYGADTLL